MEYCFAAAVHHSNTPLPHYSITPSLHHSISPPPSFPLAVSRAFGYLATGDPAWMSRTSTKGNCMAQAIMDPEKVRRFADELQRFNTDLENRLTLLHARFTALGDTWNDQEHEKFADEFKQTLKALKK